MWPRVPVMGTKRCDDSRVRRLSGAESHRGLEANVQHDLRAKALAQTRRPTDLTGISLRAGGYLHEAIPASSVVARAQAGDEIPEGVLARRRAHRPALDRRACAAQRLDQSTHGLVASVERNDRAAAAIAQLRDPSDVVAHRPLLDGIRPERWTPAYTNGRPTMNRPGVVGDFWPWKQGGSYANGSWSWKVDEQALFG